MSLEQKCLNSQTTKWNGIGTEMFELSDNQVEWHWNRNV